MDDFGGYHYFRKPPHVSIVNPQLSSGLLVFSDFSLGGGGDLESPCPVCWSLLCEPVVGAPTPQQRNPKPWGGGFFLAVFCCSIGGNEIRKMWPQDEVFFLIRCLKMSFFSKLPSWQRSHITLLSKHFWVDDFPFPGLVGYCHGSLFRGFRLNGGSVFLSWIYVGVSLNDGTPKTPQNDHF